MGLREIIEELVRRRDELEASADVNAVIAVNAGGRSYYAEIPGEEPAENGRGDTTTQGGDGHGQL